METRFQFRDFLKVFASSILLFTGFAVLFSAVPSAGQMLENFPPVVFFVIQYLLQFVILFFPLWIFVVNKYETSLEDFGFQKISWKIVVKNAALFYLAYLGLSIAVSSILTALDLKLPGYEGQESYLPLFGTEPLEIVVGLIFISLIAPFLEELLFRGFVYRIFTKTWPIWVGSLCTAVIFALAHMQIHTFFPLFILGLLLNASYRKTGSVWTSVAFHSLNNTIAFSVDIYLNFHPETLEKLTALL